MIGTTLGHYHIVEKIGSGGMGEVYRASDSKLHRDVAVKIMTGAFAESPERLSRFEREARLLAALNHPNIATLHGFETQGDVRFLVMELVPGETLAELVANGPIPLEEAIPLFRQVAEAIEAAHEKGVIHRDLKPANIKVTPNGQVKVLDLGLAKAFQGEQEASNLSESPTFTRGTDTGVILGTAAYMSPEQARGKSVDGRTDIWSFGCVLHEALTGRKAFGGETVSDTIAKILTAEPDMSALPARTPRSIRVLLERCFTKDVARRLRHLDPAQIELGHEEVVPSTNRSRAIVPYLVVALATGVAVWFLKPEPEAASPPLARFVLGLPEGGRLASPKTGLAFSSDGDLAYVAIRGEIQAIYLKSRSQLDARPLPGTEGGQQPFFSPDGEWVGFFAEGKLKKISLRGGPALALADASSPNGGSWGEDGTIVFAPRDQGGLLRIPAGGGAPIELTRTDPSAAEESHKWPEFLPGGKALVFNEISASSSDITLLLLESGERRTLIPGSHLARYAGGYLVHARDSAIFAAPFDLAALEVTGPSVPIAESVKTQSATSSFSMSPGGDLAFIEGLSEPERSLLWVDRYGTETAVSAPPGIYAAVRLSSEGRLAASVREKGSYTTHVLDILPEPGIPLRFDWANSVPAWSPDGQRFASISRNRVMWAKADGSEDPQELLADGRAAQPGCWTPDGRSLIFSLADPSTDGDIWVLHLASNGKIESEPFLQTAADEGGEALSPDGRFLAYVSNESGEAQVYVRAFPGPGGKWQISSEGGTEPLWSRGGKELFYRGPRNMMAVAVGTTPRFTAASPRALFADPYARFPWFIANYDLGADGRFLMIKTAESEDRLVLVQHWPEILKRKGE